MTKFQNKWRNSPSTGYRQHHYASAAATAVQALSLAHKCYSLLNVEKKVVEVDFDTDQSLTSSPLVIQLNTIKTAEGTSPPDSYKLRDGRTIRFKRMDWESQIKLASTSVVPVHVEAFLVQGLNDDLITYTSVFQTTGVNQFRNLDEQSNFKVLKKWQWNLSPSGNEIYRFDYHQTVSHKIIFDKDNDEGDSWAFGQLALLIVSTATGVTNDTVFLGNFNYRARFIDN